MIRPAPTIVVARVRHSGDDVDDRARARPRTTRFALVGSRRSFLATRPAGRTRADRRPLSSWSWSESSHVQQRRPRQATIGALARLPIQALQRAPLDQTARVLFALKGAKFRALVDRRARVHEARPPDDTRERKLSPTCIMVSSLTSVRQSRRFLQLVAATKMQRAAIAATTTNGVTIMTQRLAGDFAAVASERANAPATTATTMMTQTIERRSLSCRGRRRRHHDSAVVTARRSACRRVAQPVGWR